MFSLFHPSPLPLTALTIILHFLLALFAPYVLPTLSSLSSLFFRAFSLCSQILSSISRFSLSLLPYFLCIISLASRHQGLLNSSTPFEKKPDIT